VRLYAAARLHTNLFQPSFKLKQKTRIGARVIKHYHAPAIPAARVLAHAVVAEESKEVLRRLQAQSDPVQLIAEIRAVQAELGKRIDRRGLDGAHEPAAPVDLEQFATGLRIAWRHGEQRPTHRRPYRRRKPVPRRPSMLDDMHEQIPAWVVEAPGVTATEILQRLKAMHPDRFTDKHERTVQRAVKQWRAQEARRIIVEGTAVTKRWTCERVGERERCNPASGLIPLRVAPEGPQAPPTRAAPSLVRALRDARGARLMGFGDDPLRQRHGKSR